MLANPAGPPTRLGQAAELQTVAAKGIPPVTRIRIWCRMLLNLIHYGRPTPPPYIFREPPK